MMKPAAKTRPVARDRGTKPSPSPSKLPQIEKNRSAASLVTGDDEADDQTVTEAMNVLQRAPSNPYSRPPAPRASGRSTTGGHGSPGRRGDRSTRADAIGKRKEEMSLNQAAQQLARAETDLRGMLGPLIFALGDGKGRKLFEQVAASAENFLNDESPALHEIAEKAIAVKEAMREVERRRRTVADDCWGSVTTRCSR